ATWNVGTPQNPNSNGSTIDGTCMLIMDDDAAGNNTPGYVLQFISPVFDGTQYATLQLKLDVHFREVYGSSLQILVQDGDDLKEVLRLSDGDGTGEQFSDFVHIETDLSFFASEQMSIVIQYDENASWAWWAGVDNLLVLGEGNASNLIAESFNDCTLPPGWTTEVVSGNADWQFGLVNNDNAGTNVSMNGSCFAYFDDDELGQAAPFSTVRLYSPVIDGSIYSNYTLDLDVIFRRIADLENFRIGVFDGTELKTVESFFAEYGGPQFDQYRNLQIDLSLYRSEQMQLVFEYDDGDDWGWWLGIDNVKVSAEGFVNDLCQSALPIELGGNCVTGNNRNALFQGMVPSCSEQNVGSLWYRYESDYTGIVRLNTAADFNDVITIFTGDCAALNIDACSNRDEFGFTGETFYWEVLAGETYFFRINGQDENFGLARGNLCLSLEAVDAYPSLPDNDDCSNAQVIELNADCVSGNNFNATFNGPEPRLNRKSRADIWYVFEAPMAAEIEILSDANFSDVLTLYSGTCNNLTEVLSNDAGQRLHATGLNPGENYYLQIAGYFATLEGSVCVSMSTLEYPEPNNDLCTDAYAVLVDGACVEAQNAGAAFEGPTMSCEVSPQNSVWFQFDVPASGGVQINTGADFLHSVGIYTGNCTDLEEVSCTQNPLNCDGYFTVNSLVPGQTYFVQIASSSNTLGQEDGNLCLSILDVNSPPDHLPLSLQVLTNCTGAGTGQLQIIASGGVGEYLFQGTSESEELTTGETYLVIVQDQAGCEKSLSGQFDCGPAPCTLSATVETTDVTCHGAANGAAIIMLEGGIAPYTYTWSNNHNQASVQQLPEGSYTVTVMDVNACSAIVDFAVTAPDLLIGQTSATGETASNAQDGTASASPIGGVAPYTYLWSTGSTASLIDQLSPDWYVVTITDANACAVIETVVVSSFDCAIGLEITTELPTCFGAANGTATAIPINGQGPFDFVWSTGATAATIEDLSAGLYSVTVMDANACPLVAQLVVEEPNALVFELGQLTPPVCFGENTGMASLAVNGGTAPYELVWSNGFIGQTQAGLAGGTYSVVVSDANACTEVLSFNLEAPALLEATVANVQQISCAGLQDGQATVVVTGGSPDYSYYWSDPEEQTTATAVNLAPGIYDVQVIDQNECSTVVTVEIAAEPTPLAFTLDQVIHETGSNQDGAILVSVSGGNPPYAYQWSQDGNIVSEAEDPMGLSAGAYTLLVSDQNACNLITQAIIIESTTSTNDPVLAQQIFVMPNPTRGKVMVQFDLE
ncbi:MAG: SprB repeat-containing protein, partial [Bacteroidota bacterium]